MFPLICITSRLKTVDLVIRSSQGAEGVLKKYEDKLRDVHNVPNDVKEVETCRTELKVTNMASLSAYYIYCICSPSGKRNLCLSFI